MSKVKADAFAQEAMKIFESWSDDVYESVNEAVREVAKEAKKELKVGGNFQNQSGDYRKSWSLTFNKLRYGIEATVYNKKRYMLTHLLESGHAKFLWGRATGGTVQAFPHIESVNEDAQKKLEEEIKRRISG